MLSHPSFSSHIKNATLRSQALEHYFKANLSHKLQLGTGTNTRQGWFNTDLDPQLPDIYILDVTKTFPIASMTFDFIFSEHQIEHVSYTSGRFMLQECFRLLKPGGAVRIATPNLATILDLYAENRSETQENYIRFITDRFMPGVKAYHPTFVINNAFRNWGHQFLYDETTLKNVMEDAGFVKIKCATPGHSKIPEFRDLEMHGQFIGNDDINTFETLILEGRKNTSMV